jgi:ABC-type glycerol-3-phosphate transport system substrate-binding protein
MLVKGDALMMVDGSWIVSDYPDPDTAQHVGMFAMPAPAGMLIIGNQSDLFLQKLFTD